MRMKQKKAGYKEINTPELLDRALGKIWSLGKIWRAYVHFRNTQMKKYLQLNQ